jgi:hypothetical protein
MFVLAASFVLMHEFDSHKVEEYKTYKCSNCSYSEDVSGEKRRTIEGIYETHVCLNCKCVIEVCLGESFFIDSEIFFKESEPLCMLCGKNDTIVWNSEMCKCPKCNGKMDLTRLELNIDSVGKVKIV